MDATDENRQRDDMRQSLVQAESSSTTTGKTVGSVDALSKDALRRLASQNLAVTLTCTSCMLALYGYDFGITAWTALRIKAQGAADVTAIYQYLGSHGEALGILIAFAPIGGTIGGIIGHKFANTNGRKAEIQLVNLLCILGALLEGASGSRDWNNIAYVLIFVCGRAFYGIGLGLSLRCGPMYLRETITPSFRDIATVSVKLSMVGGMIVSYIVGGLLTNPIYGYLGAILISVVSLVCLEIIPESPLYMLLHEDRFSRAQILAAVRFTNPFGSAHDVDNMQREVLREILAYTPGHPSFVGDVDTTTPTTAIPRTNTLNSVTADAAPATGVGGTTSGTGEAYRALIPAASLAESLKNLPSLTKIQGMRAAILLTAGLMVFEQASGMIAILYYGGIFLADVDIIPVDWGLALLGTLQLVAAVAVLFAVNRVGRKPLLLGGLAALLVSSATLTAGGAYGFNGIGRVLILVGLYAFTASYSTSLGALVWVLVAEVFPTCHRAQAISIVSTAHFTTSAAVVILLPLVQDLGGYASMFLCFFVVAIFANIFAHRYMVETKGLTLAEMHRALTIKAGFVARPDAMRSAHV